MVRRRQRRGRGEGAVFQRSDGTWCATVQDGYRGDRRLRKTVYGRTRQEVVDKLAVMSQRRKEGRPLSDSGMRLDDYLNGWLEEVARPRLRPSTYDSYRDHIRRHINPSLGHIRLNQLAPSDLRQFIAGKREEISARGRPLSPNSIRYMHAIIRNALNDAMRDELLGRNVAQLVRAPGPSESDYVPDYFDVEQARALLAQAGGDRLEAFWRLALTGGLRKGELIGLCWEDIDLERALVHVHRSVNRFVGQGLVEGKPKSKNSTRLVRIGAGMVASLERHRARQDAERLGAGRRWVNSGRVFTTPVGTTLDPRNVARDLDELCAAAGLGRVRFHSLRHTCATLLLAEGEPLEVIADRLGHGDTRVTSQVYAKARELQEMGPIPPVARGSDRWNGVAEARLLAV